MTEIPPNNSRLDYEIEALQSIYGSSTISTLSADSGHTVVTYEDDSGNFTAKFLIPSNYPDYASPILQLQCHNNYRINTRVLPTTEQKDIVLKIEEYFQDNVGSEVLFSAIDLLRDFISARMSDENTLQIVESASADFDEYASFQVAVPDDDAGEYNSHKKDGNLKKKWSNQKETNLCHMLKIISGETIVERKSSFQAHFAVVTSMNEVNEFRSTLLSDKKVIEWCLQ